MDLSEYLPMFLAEAREHLQQLNLAVVRVEERPDDQETVDEIFRIAHSMKGMSAAMGFERMAALTHQMEDVFELLRQRTGGLPRAAIDVLLECLDALEHQIGKIERTGAEDLDPDDLIERLRGLVRARSPEQEAQRRGGAAPLPPPEVVAERAGGRRIVRVEVVLDDDCGMPSVRAFMVLRALGDHGAMLASAPQPERVDAFDGRRIEAWLAAESPDDAELAAAAEGIADVVRADVREVTADELAEAAARAAAARRRAAPGEIPPPAHPRRMTTSVRVDADRLDELMRLVEELAVRRTHVEALAATADVPGLPGAIAELARASQALQTLVMQVRMVPVEAVFLRLPRLVRDVSARLGKQAELRLVGQDTELDRAMVDALGDPLVHLVRNAVDHGLEPPEERAAAGKPRTGVVEVSAAYAGGEAVLEVRDDGRGIDPAHVAAKAVQRGLLRPEEAAAMDFEGVAELLFAPGFSTLDAASEISGRGVGMDVVRTAVGELGGEVVLSSRPGEGTTARIRLPLTLGVTSALLVEVGGERYALPMERVRRTVALEGAAVRFAASGRVLTDAGESVPLVDAGAALRGAPAGGEQAVVVAAGGGAMALAVTRVVGQRELVTRPLPDGVGAGPAVSGGAVLADGDLALVVDCDALDQAGLARAA